MMQETQYRRISKTYRYVDLRTRANELMKLVAESPHEVGTEANIKRLLQTYSLALMAKDMAPASHQASLDSQLREVLGIAYENVRVQARDNMLKFSEN